MMMLSDRRLKTSYALMKICVSIKINDGCWNDREFKEILKRALDIYLSKKLQKRNLAEDSQLVETIEPSDGEVNEIKENGFS